MSDSRVFRVHTAAHVYDDTGERWLRTCHRRIIVEATSEAAARRMATAKATKQCCADHWIAPRLVEIEHLQDLTGGGVRVVAA